MAGCNEFFGGHGVVTCVGCVVVCGSRFGLNVGREVLVSWLVVNACIGCGLVVSISRILVSENIGPVVCHMSRYCIVWLIV